jgi:hypothetical protein
MKAIEGDIFSESAYYAVATTLHPDWSEVVKPDARTPSKPFTSEDLFPGSHDMNDLGGPILPEKCRPELAVRSREVFVPGFNGELKTAGDKTALIGAVT